MIFRTQLGSSGSQLPGMGLKCCGHAGVFGTRLCSCCGERRSLRGAKVLSGRWTCRFCVASKGQGNA
jgi:formylmethanofuran dehydrogenase subunit E